MKVLSVSDINEFLYVGCKAVMRDGREVTVRGKKTKELHPCFIEIDQPRRRTLLYPHRGNNPYAGLFETLWVLGNKSNDISLLKEFLPRAVDFSDDGKAWRAGYPERIRNYGNVGWSFAKLGVDQLLYAYDKLKTDPETRQAVISLWNPEKDCYVHGLRGVIDDRNLLKSKDFPCSGYLVFLIRGGKLDLTFTIRSNDMIFGASSINFYEFSVMQEILARKLGVDVGKFYYVANSLHIYEEHYEKANIIAYDKGVDWYDFLDNESCDPETVTKYDLPIFRFGDDNYGFEDCLNGISSMISLLEQCAKVKPLDISNTNCNWMQFKWFHDAHSLCEIYLLFVNADWKNRPTIESYYSHMKNVNLSDLKVACHFWMLKHSKAIEPHDIHIAINECLDMNDRSRNPSPN